MKRVGEFTLNEIGRQLYIFADGISLTTLAAVRKKAKTKGIVAVKSEGRFPGLGGFKYAPPFTTKLTVGVPPRHTELGEKHKKKP